MPETRQTVISAFLLFKKPAGFKSKYKKERTDKELKKVRWLDKDCNKCGQQLNSWDARLSKTLAYKYPCCESCIAGEYGMTAEELRDRMENYFGIRPCQGL